ncbi:MAG: G2/mitotic-specific cyclin [Chrysothrix sp. TS-e1954]|nr:MAG: G2/mitotic-specific cyclin [Chrysothrix sp. TS-e1954]
MPAARGARQRMVNNENDENNSTRLTRSKASALNVPTDKILGTKKALQAKKGSSNGQESLDAQPRKRAALGDVSNINKADVGERVVEGKKPLVPTSGIASKAAQPTGVQKSSRTNSTRPALASKDRNAAGHDLKRPASSNSVNGPTQKKRSTLSGGSAKASEKQPSPVDENKSPAAQVEDDVEVKSTTVKITTNQTDGAHVDYELKREERKPTSSASRKAQKELDEKIELMDDEDAGDPLMVSEYVYEILEYMRVLETRTMPNAKYMDHQKELEWRMRGVLIDWLLEVHTRFHLLPETFYLTVNIIDRFLTVKEVELQRLQLVGVTAMFIASKYEEVLSPHIGNFVHVAGDEFTEEEILKAERYILASLSFDLSFPNPMHFLRRISKGDGYDIQTRTLAKFLLEISLLDHKFLAFKPSINAAASMYLSRVILEKGSWDDVLVHYSGYTEEDLKPVLAVMIGYLRGPVVHEAFYKKYAHKKFMKSSLHARNWAKKYSLDVSSGGSNPLTDSSQ